MNRQPGIVEIPRVILQTLNHLYEIERKLTLHGDTAGIQRTVDRMKDAFQAESLFWEDPMGQPFTETRTDLEATIAGEGTENLVVTEVIKPVLRFGDKAYSRVIQKGIVVVRSSDEQAGTNEEKGQEQ